MLTTVILIVSLVAAICAGLLASMSVWGCIGVFLLAVLAQLLIFVLLLIIAAVRTDMTKPIEKMSMLSRRCCDGIATLLCDLGGLRAEISGVEKLPEGERFLLVCNHRSAADPMVLAHALKKYDVAFISKPSNMALPVLGKMAYGAGFLAIDRENDRNALKTILTAANYLKKDICSICIYPEGTRSRDGKLLPFHAGSFKIAQKAGAPVVVACSLGTDSVKKNIFRLHASKLRLDILDTVSAEKVKEMSSNELAEHSRGLIAAHIEKMEGGK